MAKKFSELEAKMSPESRARSDAKAKRMLAELSPDLPTDADIREPNRAPIWNGRRNLEEAENSEETPGTKDGATKPNEPTLTCSEVVERLAECAGLNWTDAPWSGDAPYATFDTAKATAILHSWRERRVQELEEALLIAKHSGSLNSADSASNTESSSTAKGTR